MRPYHADPSVDDGMAFGYLSIMAQSTVGVVVIGRNEGERLRACLTSLRDVPARVYVDSGSSDGSCSLARSLDFDVVELAVPPGYTAARARNDGIERLKKNHPHLAFVQTVDGDCEVRPGWIGTALSDLAVDPRRAVVFGRRRERFPKANIYHRACDDEWLVAIGEVSSCGGDALFRLAALEEVGGYNPSLIAGEEPDLCLRLRQRGWRVFSNGEEMTWHDVAIDCIRQWWHRSRRTGFALEELVFIHGLDADRSWRRILYSATGWTGVMLAVALALTLAVVTQNAFHLAFAGMASTVLIAQVLRLALKHRARLGGIAGGVKWAGLMMITKVAQATGRFQYKLGRIAGSPPSLIEYKH